MLNPNEIVKQFPGTSLVEDNIKEAFEKYEEYLLTSRNEKLRDYGHSLAYFLQSARNFWAYNIDPTNEMLVTITTRNPKGEPPFVLVYPIGKSPQRLAERCYALALHLRGLSGKAVILKKIPEKYSDDFKQIGFEEYRDGDNWSKYKSNDDNLKEYKSDDDSYPELLVKLSEVKSNKLRRVLDQEKDKRVCDLINFEYGTSNFRGHIRKFYKWLNEKECDVDFHEYDHKVDKDAVQEMIKQWASFRHERRLVHGVNEGLNDLIDSHKCFLEGLATLPNNSSSEKKKLDNSFVMKISKKSIKPQASKVVGFGFFGKISDSTIGIYAELALHQRGKFEACQLETIHEKGVPGCSEVLIAQMFKAAREQKISFANFGGSESEDLIKNRRQKFMIANEDENKMKHLILY